MAILRTDIERALDDLIAHQDGLRFQGLAVAIGKLRWTKLIARPRKTDGRLEAYARASETPEGFGMGLAGSITATQSKVLADAAKAKCNFPDLKALLFVTPRQVGTSASKRWQDAVRQEHGLDLLIIEREEIVALMTMPEYAPLGATFLGLRGAAKPDVQDLVARTRRSAALAVRGWLERGRGRPFIELAAVRTDRDATDPEDLVTLELMHGALTQGGRIVLEGPGGC